MSMIKLAKVVGRPHHHHQHIKVRLVERMVGRVAVDVLRQHVTGVGRRGLSKLTTLAMVDGKCRNCSKSQVWGKVSDLLVLYSYRVCLAE